MPQQLLKGLTKVKEGVQSDFVIRSFIQNLQKIDVLNESEPNTYSEGESKKSSVVQKPSDQELVAVPKQNNIEKSSDETRSLAEVGKNQKLTEEMSHSEYALKKPNSKNSPRPKRPIKTI